MNTTTDLRAAFAALGMPKECIDDCIDAANEAPERCISCDRRVVPWYCVCLPCATAGETCDHDGTERYRWTDPTGTAHVACLACGEVL